MAYLSGKIVSKQTSCHEWKINNFSAYNDKQIGEVIISPLFADQSWYIKLYPRGYEEAAQGYISIYLCNNRDVDVKASYTVYILNEIGRKFKIDTHTNQFRRKGQKESNWGRTKVISRNTVLDPAKGFIVDDTLTLLIEISAVDDYTMLKYGSKELCAFEKLIDNEQFSDVTIIIEKKKILAHKNILSSRSLVFNAMFKYNMKENQKNVVEVKGIKYDIFMELLRFIYAGKVNNVEKIAQELFIAADRYRVNELKTKCEAALMSTIDNDKVLDCFQLADTYNATSLKKKLIDYIIENGKNIVNTSKFEVFAVAHPLLALEISRKLINVS